MKEIVDYTFYKEVYNGDILTPEEFNKYSLKATQYLLNMILGKDYTNYCGKDYSNEVKFTLCELAETEKDYLANGQTNIRSESIGDLSRSYGSADEQVKAIKSKREDIIRNNLGYTGLLFRGTNV